MNILDFAMPASLMSQPISRQDWLDGYAIPRGKTTLFAVPQGSGKTTSVMTAMVELSTSGTITLLGRREYGAPQRCILVTGEETYDDIRRKLAADHPSLRQQIEDAVTAGRLVFVCLKELREKNAISGPMFDEKGHPTDDWRKIAGAIKSHEPAFVFIDTLNSVSACEYMDSQSPYVTIPALDALAKATGAAVMISTHTSKEGMKGEIDEKTPANTLLASMRGSGQLSAAARCVIVMAEASSRAFSTLEVEDGDAKYAMILKTSLSHPDVMRVLPVIRSRKRKTYIATTQSDNGEHVVSLHAAVKDGAERIYAQLEVTLSRLIRAASATRSPFSETGKYAIPSLVTSTLAGLFPAGTEAHHIEHVLDALEGVGVIEKARGSRAGSMIYDVKGGMFSADHDPATGKAPVIRKGAPLREMLVEVVGAASEREVETIIAHYVERLAEGAAAAGGQAADAPAHAPEQAVATEDRAVAMPDHSMATGAPADAMPDHAVVTDALADPQYNELEAYGVLFGDCPSKKRTVYTDAEVRAAARSFFGEERAEVEVEAFYRRRRGAAKRSDAESTDDARHNVYTDVDVMSAAKERFGEHVESVVKGFYARRDADDALGNDDLAVLKTDELEATGMAMDPVQHGHEAPVEAPAPVAAPAPTDPELEGLPF